MYCAEINVVLARRLWPRTIVQPPLTEADRASMALQALQNQRRPEQHIEVTFDDRRPGTEGPAGTPRTPDEVAPPASHATSTTSVILFESSALSGNKLVIMKDICYYVL